MKKSDYHIKEDSWLAKLAAKKLRVPGVALVIGNTIHLFNTTRETFLENDKWVRHELCHIRQFRQHGFVMFIVKYLWESIKHGYYNNRYEIEAREAECYKTHSTSPNSN